MNKTVAAVSVLLSSALHGHAVLALPNWSLHKDVQYGVTTQETLDLYLLNRGTNPLIIFIHGGAWTGGDKSSYAYYAELYANAGFSVASVNYRLATVDPSTQWNAQLQDVQLAVRWLRKNASAFRIDSTRIGAAGDSSGAHLALFLGSLTRSAPGDRSNILPSRSPKVSAVVDMFGPTDLPAMAALLGGLPLFGGKTYSDAPNLYWNASPIRVVSRQTAPTCIVQGADDTVVPPSQAIELVDRLRKLGVPYQWIPFNGGHGFVGLPPSQKAAVDSKALQCAARYLHPNPANSL